MAILKIQVEQNLDWNDVCKKFAELANANEDRLNKLADGKAEKKFNSKFLTQLNAAKLSEHNKGYELGYKDARLEYEI